jgi:hypothetical protein
MTFFRGSFQGSLPQGDAFVSNLHILSSGTLAAVHATFSGAATTFWNALRVYLPPSISLDNIVTTELNPATGKNVSALVLASGLLGSGTAPAVPQQTCILVSLRTSNASKSGRGRQYFPSPVVGILDPLGTISVVAATAIDTAYTAMMTTINGSGQLVVQHGGFTGRDGAGKPIYAPLSSDPVTVVQVYRTLATQRRRLNKVVRPHTT